LQLLDGQTVYRNARELSSLDEFVFGENTRRSIEALAAGFGAFFAPLQQTQPLTWSRLRAREDEMLIVQDVHLQARRLTQHYVVVPIQAGLVVFRAFDKLDERDDMEQMLAAVPAGLRCYQHTFSSVGLYNGEIPRAPEDQGALVVGLPDRFLFCAVRECRRVDVFRGDYRIPKKALARMEATLGNLWHISAISSDHKFRNVLLIDENNASAQKLYCVMDRKYEDFFEIADPVAAVDAYLATVLDGAFRRFDFTPFRA
jgi:hypothetical protein